ncbi:MAG: response regulator [Candidatus Omnitrophica bacterium]|nr:response regulator [Candidatus Omnitrophota bacterium]
MAEGGSRVLLVDDDESTIKMVGKHLEVAGFEVLVAMDGEDALAKAREAHPDVIVLDLLMPKLSGLKVCAALKQDQASQHIPIIILTGKEDVVDERACRACGADDYLTKSAGASTLVEHITSLLRKT